MSQIPVGVSNRHIHLSQKHLSALFGDKYELRNLKNLSQPGQFATRETLKIQGPRGAIDYVRILGPVRRETQIEISKTDSYLLGVHAPIRESGNLAGTPGLKIIGPCGEIDLAYGVIVAARHIHFHPTDAERFNVKNGQMLKVCVDGERGLVFDKVIARVHPQYALDMHIDTDEANAAGIENGSMAALVLN